MYRFKKTAPTYKERTTRGGVLTVVLAFLIGILVWTEAVSPLAPKTRREGELIPVLAPLQKEYLYGEADYGKTSLHRSILHN